MRGSQPAARLGIVGLGVAGLSTAVAALDKGFEVLGFDAVAIGHEGASSAGPGKVMRCAYGDVFYTRLAAESLRRWHELSTACGVECVEPAIAIHFGPDDAAELAAVTRSLGAAARRFDVVRSGDAAPDEIGLRLSTDEIGICEHGAGMFRPARVLGALRDHARRRGAVLHEHCPVRAISPQAAGVRLTTGAGVEDVDRVVVAAGPWVRELVPDLAPVFAVTRQYQAVLETAGAAPAARFVWTSASPPFYYGLCRPEESWHLVSAHAQGSPVHPDAPSIPALRDEAVASAVECARSRFPRMEIRSVRHVRTCHYTNTVDEGFVVDRCPGLPEAIVLSACSGHGFKFGVTMGEYAARLAVGEPIPDPDRFHLRAML